MAGSVAEERIREKVVAALRARRPAARIIHELVLKQGGERIDLAAVWDDGLIVAEIKSERDTLSRLQAQIKRAAGLECEVWLCCAEKWRAALDDISRTCEGQERIETAHGYMIRSLPNPRHLPELRLVEVRYEVEAGLEPSRTHASSLYRHRVLNGAALLQMLWADELRQLSGLGSRSTRDDCIRHAREHMTGRQVRQGVCAALRARTFPRADPPIVTNGVRADAAQPAGAQLV